MSRFRLSMMAGMLVFAAGCCATPKNSWESTTTTTTTIRESGPLGCGGCQKQGVIKEGEYLPQPMPSKGPKPAPARYDSEPSVPAERPLNISRIG